TREIRNTNDEITVSYLFYELQRVYDVRQWLYDVVPIVYVAMDVPPAREINDDFVIRHDWLIAGAILDKSDLDAISSPSREMPGLVALLKVAEDLYAKAAGLVDSVKNAVQAAEAD